MGMVDIKLIRGDMVVATRHLDPGGANVRAGTVGVVFELANAYNDGAGPQVRWMNMGLCAVQDKDIIKLPIENKRV